MKSSLVAITKDNITVMPGFNLECSWSDMSNWPISDIVKLICWYSDLNKCIFLKLFTAACTRMNLGVILRKSWNTAAETWQTKPPPSDRTLAIRLFRKCLPSKNLIMESPQQTISDPACKCGSHENSNFPYATFCVLTEIRIAQKFNFKPNLSGVKPFFDGYNNIPFSPALSIIIFSPALSIIMASWM